MSGSKYIIFKTDDNNRHLNKIPDGNEVPVIFPNHIDHKVMASAMMRLRLSPIAAGFCFIDKDGWYKVRGRSESLNLDTRTDDEDIINCYLSGG